MPHSLALLKVVLLGVFTGAMLLIALSLMSYWGALSPEAFRESFRAIGPSLGNTMVPLLFGAVALSAVVALLDVEHRELAIVTFLLVAAILPLYAIVHAPVNEALLGTEALDAPALAALRSRWFLWHWARTIMGAGAFLLTILSVSRRTR